MRNARSFGLILYTLYFICLRNARAFGLILYTSYFICLRNARAFVLILYTLYFICLRNARAFGLDAEAERDHVPHYCLEYKAYSVKYKIPRSCTAPLPVAPYGSCAGTGIGTGMGTGTGNGICVVVVSVILAVLPVLTLPLAVMPVGGSTLRPCGLHSTYTGASYTMRILH